MAGTDSTTDDSVWNDPYLAWQQGTSTPADASGMQPGIGVPISALDQAPPQDVASYANTHIPIDLSQPGPGEPGYVAPAAPSVAMPASSPDMAAPNDQIPLGTFDAQGNLVPAVDGPYTTTLDPKQEQAFQTWRKDNKVPFDASAKSDYDMRGFYQALTTGDPRATTAINPNDGRLHFPDTWKTPNHATFSNESIYATPAAPSWQGNKLVDRNGNVVADETTPVTTPGVSIGTPSLSAMLGGPVTSPDQVSPGAAPPPTSGPITSPDQAVNAGATQLVQPGATLPGSPVTRPSQLDAPSMWPSIADVAAPSGPSVDLSADAAYRDFVSGKSSPDQRQIDLGRMTPDQQEQAVLKMTPEERIAYGANLEKAATLKSAADHLNLEHQNLLAAKANLDDFQAATVKANAETQQNVAAAMALSQRSAGAKLSTTQKFGGYAASIISGMLNPTGPNQGIAAIQKAIDNSVDEQKADIANQWRGVETKQGAIATELARHGDLYKAQETYRIAGYQGAINGLVDEQQKYVVGGTTQLKIASTIDQLHGLQQQAAQNLADHNLNNAINERKSMREDATLAETIRHNMADEGLKAAKGKGGVGGIEGVPLTKAQLAAQLPKGAWIPDLQPGQTMTLKDYGKVAEIGGHGLEAAGKQVSNAETASKDTVSAPIAGVGFAPMTTADGNVWRPPEKFKEMLSGAARVNDHANQLARDIATLGGSSDTLNSADNQKVRADFKALILGMHEAEKIEGFRPGTADMLQEMLGGASPTSLVRDARAGILRARDNVNSDLNVEAKVGNYDGPPIQFADTSRVMAHGANVTIKDQYNERRIVAAPGKDATPAEQDQGYTNQQEQFAFAQAGALAHGSPDAQDAARATLQQIAQHGGTAEYRDLAQTILAKSDPSAPKLSPDERRMKREMDDEDRKKTEEKASVRARANDARATAGAVGD